MSPDPKKYCYECGGSMNLHHNKHGGSWQCKCGHSLPEQVNERQSSKSYSVNNSYINSLKESGFLMEKYSHK